MSNLDLKSLQMVELDANEGASIDGGCIGWFCIGELYEAWNDFKQGFAEGFEKGANDGANSYQ
jgi:hypothetical protein